MIAPLLISCIGGPLDGEQHQNYGQVWDELPGGVYRLVDGEYRWESE